MDAAGNFYVDSQAAPLFDSVGNLFGTTHFGGRNDSDSSTFGGGVVFELSGASYHILHRFYPFENCVDGEYPSAPLVLDATEAVVGAASKGGAFGSDENGGALFELRV